MPQPYLFHQSSSPWVFITAKREVELKLKTDLSVASVNVIYGDPHQFIKEHKMYHWQSHTRAMQRSDDGQFAYFTCTLAAPNHRLKYAFEITADAHFYFGPKRCTATLETDLWNYFFIPYVHESKRYIAPAWVKDTLWYQIFPDRFHAGDRSDWGNPIVNNATHYGGTLKGIQTKLPYLRRLGISGLYLTPIFKAPSAHKYDTLDYFTIDPHFGTQQDLIDLVQAAHQLGIRVMLDAVFNHTGSEFPAFKEAQDPTHPKRAWYQFNEDGYETFSTVKNMPKLNTDHPEVIDYFTRVGTYWIEVADIDGWRLDVANEVSDTFWRHFRKAIKALKPEAYILGELWHDGMPWLNGDMFDGVMNYAFTDSIVKTFIDASLPAQDFVHEYLQALHAYPLSILDYQFNLLDSHDTARIMTRAQGHLAQVQQALALLFLSPGSPCIYYGTEIGLEGTMDPDCRRLMQFTPDPLSHPLAQWIQTLSKIKTKLKPLDAYTSLRLSLNHNCLMFRRDSLTVYFNLGSQTIKLSETGQLLASNSLYDTELSAHAVMIFSHD